MDEYDPMPDLKEIVEEATAGLPSELQLQKISIGAFDGNEPTPFAFLRSIGGSEPDAQDPEAERRLDVTVFAATEADANRISNRIHRHIRRRSQEHREAYELYQGGHPDHPVPPDDLTLPSLFSAGGPLDILERDLKLPGVFRSYYLIYAEGD